MHAEDIKIFILAHKNVLRTVHHLDQEEDRIWGGGRENCLQYPQQKQCLPLPQESRQRGGWEEGEGGQERGEFVRVSPPESSMIDQTDQAPAVKTQNLKDWYWICITPQKFYYHTGKY